MRRRTLIRARRLAAAGAGLALAAGISGCSGDSGSAQPLNLAAGPTFASASAAPAATYNIVTLQNLTVTPAQIGTGWTSQTVDNGDDVDGQITLELCGATYPSEQLRLGRHQIVLIPQGSNPDSDDDLMNEVVAYSTGGAQQARNELLQAVAHCPKDPVQVPGIDGLSLVKSTILPTDPSWLPGTVAVRTIITTADDQKDDEVDIYQFQGDFLSGVYGLSVGGKPGPNQLKAAAGAATLLKSAAGASQ